MTVPSKTHRPARAVFASALLAAALALGGCFSALIPSGPEASVSAPALPPVEGPAASFYNQQLVWEACAGRFQCTTVTAPKDWNHPENGSIELAAIRLPAGSAHAERAVLTNPGGPGGSGVDFLIDAWFLFSPALLDRVDVVSWDPRGVGSSTPVTCLDDAEMDDFLFDIPEGSRDSHEREAAVQEATDEFVAACERETGDLLEFITTEQSARDMDLLRHVLARETLDYIGFSYGTQLGTAYAETFPDRVGRFVLDGAIDPSVPSIEVGLAQAVGFSTALDSFLEACVGGAFAEIECPFSGSLGNARADLATLLTTLDVRPIVAADGREFGADALMQAIITGLYNEGNWPTIAQAMTGALQGDARVGFVLADAYFDRDEAGTYASNSTEAFIAYNCMDYPETPETENDEYQRRLEQEAPLIAPYWTGGDTCSAWPYAPTGTRRAAEADDAPPIVVIGTTGDPATPYAWSVALAEQLPDARLVTFEGEGHTAYGNGNLCVADAVDEFILDGVLPAADTTCR